MTQRAAVLDTVAPTRRRRMRQHARRLAELVARATRDRRAPWLAALIGRRARLRELDHYPPDDVVERASGAQCFVHAHDGDTHGFAHFHCFVRLPGRALGIGRPWVTTHVAALSVDEHGWPLRLLAVNQWTTGELWQPARRTLALLERLDFRAPTPEAEAGRWLASVLHVYWPELQRLLAVRDARLRRELLRHPGTNVLQDRNLEVLCAIPIDLMRRLRALGITS
jgi:hypothetical protein